AARSTIRLSPKPQPHNPCALGARRQVGLPVKGVSGLDTPLFFGHDLKAKQTKFGSMMCACLVSCLVGQKGGSVGRQGVLSGRYFMSFYDAALPFVQPGSPG